MLERVLNEIVRRHEVLRTTFSIADGQPVQVIAPVLEPNLPTVDLRHVPASSREAEAQRLIREEMHRPFDLARGPLFRAALLRLEEAEHVLVVAMPHIVTDGWSMGILYEEMAALTGAFLAGKPSPLPDLPIQYADFAYWQRKWMQGEAYQAHLSYWKERLSRAPVSLELHTDRPRPPFQRFRGATEPLNLSLALTDALKDFSQREGVTLFMTLMAAFKTLLHRYTHQDDIVIGTFLSNRNRAEMERMIGFFVNSVALRTDFSGNPSFRQLLKQVREVTLGAYAHQDMPFDLLLEELRLGRPTNRTPLFQVAINLQNFPVSHVELPGLTVSLMEADRPVVAGGAQLDLTLNIKEFVQGLGLYGEIFYDSTLFDAPTIAQMVRHFCTLLESIVADPEQHVLDLPLMTAVERQNLLVELNSASQDMVRDACIHELFEGQVERTPDAVAVSYEQEQLTYRESNSRANRLAHYLTKLGVGPEKLVGICMERSVGMVVGVLGVLKAGGAYVPLDPSYPQERIAFMLHDSQAQVLITQQSSGGDTTSI